MMKQQYCQQRNLKMQKNASCGLIDAQAKVVAPLPQEKPWESLLQGCICNASNMRFTSEWKTT